MSNLLDYIRWRGDLPLDVIPLGEVDGLILSQLSMMKWENWIGPGDAVALNALADRLDVDQMSVGFTDADDRKLMALATVSVRFGGIQLFDYERDSDAEAEKQFAAISALLPDGTLFVAFRGTDSTLTGWKEDFNMAFSEPVPAQRSALTYLERAGRRFGGALRVGGHSKGGNLAMYASALAEESVWERIADVYNNDGPGLSDCMDVDALYARLGRRLHSFVPQSSVVGMLLSHPETYEVVRSTSVSVLQHNPYSWRVEGSRFVRAPGLSRDSVRFESVFRRWLSRLSEAQREALVETLFTVLSASDAENIDREFVTGLLLRPRTLINALQRVDRGSRKDAAKALSELASAALHAKA